MTLFSSDFWTELQRRALEGYDEELLRQVTARLVKPRNHWPVSELIERGAGVFTNPVVLDRRLQELQPASRQLLAMIGQSRQPLWELGHLIALTFSLGQEDVLRPVLDLLEGGLLYPVGGTASQPRVLTRLRSFEHWLGGAGTGGLWVFAAPQVSSRAQGEDLGLPDLSGAFSGAESEESRVESPRGVPFGLSTPEPQEADGLEWVLRLAVLWQQVTAAPLRRTMQGAFFKRDHERLVVPSVLIEPSPDQLVELPGMGFLAVELAEWLGIVREEDSEVRAASLPTALWEQGLAPSLEAFWSLLPRITTWDPWVGWRDIDTPGASPFPSANLLLFLLLARAPEEAWLAPGDLERWLSEHHPYWKGEGTPYRQGPWVETFLLGFAYPLRLVQALRVPQQGWRVRLSETGRWLLGRGGEPPADAVYSQTLLIQPNLEILAYRQGLTAGLIARLSQCASWKTLGAACTLQLEPETVYRALESGETFESIRLILEQHSTRGVPPAVLDSLRTWSDKRDRITVYPSATLLEFSTPEDLNEALARGLAAVRLTPTLAAAPGEEAIDYRNFRLTGTRDYSLPPEPCVSVGDDGVTLTVDLARADLLLETELPRFAEPLPRRLDAGPGGLPGDTTPAMQRQYRLTPTSLASAVQGGMSVLELETWFQQRAAQPLSAAARLLMTGSQLEPPQLQTYLVLRVASAEIADGLMQWPGTRSLIQLRLGPTALVIPEEYVEVLRERLQEAGMELGEQAS
jgi:hypothetical protein